MAICSLIAVAALLAVAGPRPFRAQEAGQVWSLVAPGGRPFWSLGVCCVDPGTDWAKYDPANPSYAAFHSFKSGRDWAKDAATKLESWGFDSLGGWCDNDLLRSKGVRQLPFTVVLHLGAYFRAPWDDLYDPKAAQTIDQAAKDQIPKVRDDPNLIGYFTDNELGWWTETLFLYYLKMPPSAPGRRELVVFLRRFYRDDFKRFTADWICRAADWGTLDHPVEMKLRPGGDGVKAVEAWVGAFASHYYRLVRDAVRRYDKRALILGDRYCQYYDMAVAKAARAYVDVVSTNLGADWNDGTLSPFFLDSLHRLTGKPLLISEFYMAARENRTGNRNAGEGFAVVQTQAERAASFKRYVESVAALPYVVGAHWFQFYDEPPKGRGDGENYDFGLVDVNGVPYDEMIQAARSLKLERRLQGARGTGLAQGAAARLRSTGGPVMIGEVARASRPWFAGPSRPSKKRLYGSRARSDIAEDGDATPRRASIGGALPAPLAPGDATAGLRDWDRKDGLVPPTQGVPFADLYVCADSKYLYLGLYSMEYLDESIYEGGRIPESERSACAVSVGARSFVVRFGGKNRKAACDHGGVDVFEQPGLKDTLILRIPRAGLPESPELSVRLTSHGRGYATAWKATLRLPGSGKEGRVVTAVRVMPIARASKGPAPFGPPAGVGSATGLAGRGSHRSVRISLESPARADLPLNPNTRQHKTLGSRDWERERPREHPERGAGFTLSWRECPSPPPPSPRFRVERGSNESSDS